MRLTTLCALALAVLATPALASPFKADDLVIYRTGSGAAALSNAATVVYLDEYTTTGQLVQSIALPTSGAGRLTASGTATSEGELTVSADGRFLAVTGYDAAAGTATVKGTASSSVKRVVDLYDYSGKLASTTLLDAYSGDNFRSAVTLDGTTLFTGGNGTSATAGVRAGTVGESSSTRLISSPTNVRQVNVFDGQLYFSTGSGTTGVFSVGSGTPTTAGQTKNLIAATGSPYGFYFADLNNAVAGVDTLYVADDSAGLVKFVTADGVSWTKNGSIATSGLTGLTGRVSNGVVQLFSTSASKLYSFTDTSGAGGLLNGSLVTLASAGTNTAFRGLSVTPVPEPETFVLMLAGLGLLGFVASRRN